MSSLATRLALPLVFLAVLTTGCTSWWQAYSGGERRGVSSSLVEYLYPGGEEPPPVVDTVPQLHIPLRVGLAFVPSDVKSATPVLSEVTKSELLEKVREQFLDRDYIAEIEVISENYMRTGRGFTSLQQISRIYNVDVMALVSYDQVVAHDDTKSSFLYWTIIGAYVVKGSKNEVQTFVDTAVFDIPTRRLLFRAPGIDTRTSRSTLVETGEDLRDSRAQSFAIAMDDMSENLAIELNKFEFRIKEDPSVAQVVSRSGGGGGAISLLALLFLLAGPLLARSSSLRQE